MKIQSNNKKHFILFNFCKVVEGKDKSIICDFQKGKIKFIPNQMVEVINMLKEKPFETVKEFFSEDLNIFESYINFLTVEGFAFFTKNKDNFIDIDNYWTSPEVINNALIEYQFGNYNLMNVLTQLDHLLTKFIEIRFTEFNTSNITEFKEILSYCTNSVSRSIRIFVPFVSKELSEELIDIIKLHPIVDCILFYNSNYNKEINNGNTEVHYITKSLKDIEASNIDRKFLINSIEYFYECQKFNPYYNKKVAIDSEGQLKNCLKNKKVFGNLKNDSIKQIVLSNEFQEFWHVTHDQIEGIKDSELRYNYIITNDLEKTSNGNYKIIA